MVDSYLTVQKFYNLLLDCDPKAKLDVGLRAGMMDYTTGVTHFAMLGEADWNFLSLSFEGHSLAAELVRMLEPFLDSHGQCPVTSRLCVLPLDQFTLQPRISIDFAYGVCVRSSPFDPRWNPPNKQTSLQMLITFLDTRHPSDDLLKLWYNEHIHKDYDFEFFEVGDKRYTRDELFARFAALASDPNWKELFSRRESSVPVSFYECLFAETDILENSVQ